MTSVLNFVTSSSTNATNIIPPLSGSSLFSNVKLPTTFIIQPPSSHQNKPNTLLTKRYKPAELGDLLMKKIKTQMISSENNSSQQSPILKENVDDNLESTSMIEEIASPSVKSTCEDNDKHHTQKLIESLLIPQRSLSTPLVINPLNMGLPKSDIAGSHKQVQHALEILEKKMRMEQQAASLREILFKVQLSQEPLVIPPLLSSSHSTQSSIEKNSMKMKEEETEYIYGPVEYPLLNMAAPFSRGCAQKDSSNPLASSIGLGNGKQSNEAQKTTKKILESLCVTRAETQRSESDETDESLSEMAEDKKRKSKKSTNMKNLETVQKGKEIQKKEKKVEKQKTKGKQQKREEPLSPLITKRKLTERKMNKWQTTDNYSVNIDESKKKGTTFLSVLHSEVATLSDKNKLHEETQSKMKWESLAQDKEAFFESLRSLLNIEINQEKATKILKDNNNDIKKALEFVEANKAQFLEELTK